MSTLEIPTRNDILDYQYTLTLEDLQYIFHFSYNKRMERWLLNIMDNDENILIGSILLLSGYNLIGRYKNTLLPKGVLFLIDIQGNNTTAVMDTLGNNVTLLYGESS